MKKAISTFVAGAFIILMSACTKTETSDTGRLVVKVTDDPFNISYVESATVTITKIEIRKICDCIPDGSPFIVISEDPVIIDLIDLRNGVVEELADLEIPAGEYDLVRLYVDEASLKLFDIASPFKVKVPGGQQTGIKVFMSPVLRVEGGLTSELLLDFDLSRSFVMRGNLHHSAGVNGFIFKPCIRATNLSTAGRIEGMVTDTVNVKIENAKVWVEQDTVVATAFTDASGYYAFIGIPAGTYSILATKENYDTVEYAGIKVIEGNRTIQNFALHIK